jgi:hypothetical protein
MNHATECIDDRDIPEGLAEYRRSVRQSVLVVAALLLVAALPVVAGFVRPLPYLVFVAYLVVIVSLVCSIVFRSVLVCPHCHQNPALGGQAVSPVMIDHCAKCAYWLLNPRRGRFS